MFISLCLFPGRNFLLDVSNGGKGRKSEQQPGGCSDKDHHGFGDLDQEGWKSSWEE